jgi:hypothetical protein
VDLSIKAFDTVFFSFGFVFAPQAEEFGKAVFLLALPDLLLPQIHRQIAVHSNHDYQIYRQPITANDVFQ